ncbi:hypothetical protein AAMO2058_001017000 [Amorphochlora amoebiformis]
MSRHPRPQFLAVCALLCLIYGWILPKNIQGGKGYLQRSQTKGNHTTIRGSKKAKTEKILKKRAKKAQWRARKRLESKEAQVEKNKERQRELAKAAAAPFPTRAPVEIKAILNVEENISYSLRLDQKLKDDSRIYRGDFSEFDDPEYLYRKFVNVPTIAPTPDDYLLRKAGQYASYPIGTESQSDSSKSTDLCVEFDKNRKRRSEMNPDDLSTTTTDDMFPFKRYEKDVLQYRKAKAEDLISPLTFEDVYEEASFHEQKMRELQKFYELLREQQEQAMLEDPTNPDNDPIRLRDARKAYAKMVTMAKDDITIANKQLNECRRRIREIKSSEKLKPKSPKPPYPTNPVNTRELSWTLMYHEPKIAQPKLMSTTRIKELCDVFEKWDLDEMFKVTKELHEGLLEKFLALNESEALKQLYLAGGKDGVYTPDWDALANLAARKNITMKIKRENCPETEYAQIAGRDSNGKKNGLWYDISTLIPWPNGTYLVKVVNSTRARKARMGGVMYSPVDSQFIRPKAPESSMSSDDYTPKPLLSDGLSKISPTPSPTIPPEYMSRLQKLGLREFYTNFPKSGRMSGNLPSGGSSGDFAKINPEGKGRDLGGLAGEELDMKELDIFEKVDEEDAEKKVMGFKGMSSIAERALSVPPTRKPTSEPRISEPRISEPRISDPSMPASEPRIPTSQPKLSSSKPKISSLEPRISVSEPNVSALEPTVSESRISDSVSRISVKRDSGGKPLGMKEKYRSLQADLGVKSLKPPPGHDPCNNCKVLPAEVYCDGCLTKFCIACFDEIHEVLLDKKRLNPSDNQVKQGVVGEILESRDSKKSRDYRAKWNLTGEEDSGNFPWIVTKENEKDDFCFDHGDIDSHRKSKVYQISYQVATLQKDSKLPSGQWYDLVLCVKSIDQKGRFDVCVARSARSKEVGLSGKMARGVRSQFIRIKPVRYWTPIEVNNWAGRKEISPKLRGKLRKKNIGGPELIRLNSSEAKSLGLRGIGVKKLLGAVKNLRNNQLYNLDPWENRDEWDERMVRHLEDAASKGIPFDDRHVTRVDDTTPKGINLYNPPLPEYNPDSTEEKSQPPTPTHPPTFPTLHQSSPLAKILSRSGDFWRSRDSLQISKTEPPPEIPGDSSQRDSQRSPRDSSQRDSQRSPGDSRVSTLDLLGASEEPRQRQMEIARRLSESKSAGIPRDSRDSGESGGGKGLETRGDSEEKRRGILELAREFEAKIRRSDTLGGSEGERVVTEDDKTDYNAKSEDFMTRKELEDFMRISHLSVHERVKRDIDAHRDMYLRRIEEFRKEAINALDPDLRDNTLLSLEKKIEIQNLRFSSQEFGRTGPEVKPFSGEAKHDEDFNELGDEVQPTLEFFGGVQMGISASQNKTIQVFKVRLSKKLALPADVAADPRGKIYICQPSKHRILMALPNGEVSILAGEGGYKAAIDGIGTEAKFNTPSGICVDLRGQVYIADYGNHRIRTIVPSKETYTLAGGKKAGYRDGSGTDARFLEPRGICVNAKGSVLIADLGNHCIRHYDKSRHMVTTVAGIGGERGDYIDGPGSIARFKLPTDVDIDSFGHIYVCDNGNGKIRRIDAFTGEVSTLGGEFIFNKPTGVAVSYEGTTVYVTETNSHKIYRLDHLPITSNDERKQNTKAEWKLYAGDGTKGEADGFALLARFSKPMGVACDFEKRLLVADSQNNRIAAIEETARESIMGETDLLVPESLDPELAEKFRRQRIEQEKRQSERAYNRPKTQDEKLVFESMEKTKGKKVDDAARRIISRIDEEVEKEKKRDFPGPYRPGDYVVVDFDDSDVEPFHRIFFHNTKGRLTNMRLENGTLYVIKLKADAPIPVLVAKEHQIRRYRKGPGFFIDPELGAKEMRKQLSEGIQDIYHKITHPSIENLQDAKAMMEFGSRPLVNNVRDRPKLEKRMWTPEEMRFMIRNKGRRIIPVRNEKMQFELDREGLESSGPYVHGLDMSNPQHRKDVFVVDMQPAIEAARANGTLHKPEDAAPDYSAAAKLMHSHGGGVTDPDWEREEPEEEGSSETPDDDSEFHIDTKAIGRVLKKQEPNQWSDSERGG